MQYSNPKGSKWERDVCRILSSWITNGKDEYTMKRNPGSGGSKSDKEGFAVGGDIIAVKSPAIKFCETFSVECKFHKELNRPTLVWLTTGQGKISDFIKQAKEDADKYNKNWLLVCKTNLFPAFVVSNSPKFERIESCWGLGKGNLYFASLDALVAFPYKTFMRK